MLFGGVDIPKYSKKGLTDKDVFWAKQSENKMYWAVDNNEVKLGKASITKKAQQVILDNGMSFAMAPEDTFLKFVEEIYKEAGILCFQMQPVWGCTCNEKQFENLPPLAFWFTGMSSSVKMPFFMPREAYMMHKKNA